MPTPLPEKRAYEATAPVLSSAPAVAPTAKAQAGSPPAAPAAASPTRSSGVPVEQPEEVISGPALEEIEEIGDDAEEVSAKNVELPRRPPPPPPREAGPGGRRKPPTPPPVHVDQIAAALSQPSKASATGPQDDLGLAEGADAAAGAVVVSAGTGPVSSAAIAAAADSKRRRRRPWFEEVFSEDFLRTVPPLDEAQKRREIEFVASSLKLPQGGQVLDVGCGTGWQAIELAARGQKVVGLDASTAFLLRAAEDAQRRGVEVSFIQGDMRELSYEGQFDGACCLLTTFGYFDDETNRRVAQKMAQALKPGGRLLVDVVNRDYAIADLPARIWWEGDNCVVLEEVDFNYYTSRLVSHRSVVFADGRQLEQDISVRAYSLHEIGKLLHGAGFRVLEVSGSVATRGRFFGAESRQLLILAEKRGDPPPDRVG